MTCKSHDLDTKVSFKHQSKHFLEVQQDQISAGAHELARSSRSSSMPDEEGLAYQRKVLEWISPTNYPAQQSDILSHRQEGTFQWLLDEPSVVRWLDESIDAPTLFCSGTVGAGKSMVAAIVIDHLLKSVQDSSHGVAYVFFNYAALRVQTTLKLLRAILKQLAQAQSSIPESIELLYKQHAKRGAGPSLDQVIDALQDTLALYTTVHIVVDGLNENIRHGLDLVAKLRDLQTGRNLRILATSRPWADVLKAFEGFPSIQVGFSKTTDSDVRRFVENRVPAWIQNQPTLLNEITYQIKESCADSFYVAHLKMKLLSKATVPASKEVIEAILGTNEYAMSPHAWVHKSIRDNIWSQPPDDLMLAKKVISWIMCAQRPLTVTEISCALVEGSESSKSQPEEIPDIGHILSVCSDLVVIDKQSDIIRFLNTTTAVFFLHQKAWLPDARSYTADVCFTYLFSKRFSSGSCPTDETFEERLRQNGFLRYAARYLGAHAKAAEEEAIEKEPSEIGLRVLQDGNLVASIVQVMEVPEEAHRGPGYSQRFSAGTTGLHLTAKFGLIRLSRKLLDGLDKIDEVNLQDQYGRTPLSYAALRGNGAVVDLLVSHEAVNIDLTDQGGRSPLSWAAGKGYLQVVELLLEKKADPNRVDVCARSPLHWAAMNGHDMVVSPLIRNGAHIDSKNGKGSTALHESIRNGYEEVQKLLMHLGADLDVADGDGKTASDLAWAKKRLDWSSFSLDDDTTRTINQGRQARCEVLRRTSGADIPQVIFCKKFDIGKKAGKLAKRCLLREYKTLQRLDHPFIVSYLGYEEDLEQKTAALYMEFCDGGDFETTHVLPTSDDEDSDDDSDGALVESGRTLPTPLKEHEVWSIIFQLAAAMAYLHHGLSMKYDRVSFERHWRSVIHRDIKPANVVSNTLQDERSIVKLCDLGLVRAVDGTKQTRASGSMFYSPPEVRSNKDWTVKGDIYSFGVTIDELHKESKLQSQLTDMLEDCKSVDPSSRPSSLTILETAQNHLPEHERSMGAHLHELLGEGPGGYLMQALETIASALDEFAAFGSEVRSRRDQLLKRLNLLCEDGAGNLFDKHSRSLHLAVLLDRQDKLEGILNGSESVHVNEKWANSGWTPLHLAIQEGNERLTSILIEHGADSVADRYLQPPSYYHHAKEPRK